MVNWDSMTAGEAEALAFGFYVAQHERYVAGSSVGEPTPDEWEPVDAADDMPPDYETDEIERMAEGVQG